MSAFKKNYAGIGEMLRMPGVEAALREMAERAEAAAVAAAPVGPADDPHRGRYKASFEVSSGSHGGVHKDRAFGRLENTSEESFYVEYGTSQQEGRHIIRIAAEGSGGL
ncbi:MAG TPA: hypothetical protein VFM01_05205 [Nakamurella sp.]|nr:hypothetical protein [Nakamurella sp.]